MKKDHRENRVGPWAEQKLTALEKYLTYYCLYLSKKNFTLVYIDGFAGAPITKVRGSDANTSLTLWGEADDAERERYVSGSPVRALRTNPGFQRHYFFDLDENRVASLNALKDQFPDKWVHIEVGDANERIRRFMKQLDGRRDVKGVAFLDPYRDNLEWETVEALARNKGFEVIINLPLHMAINRLLAKQAERNVEWEQRIDRCFGTQDWREIVYPSTQDMFGTVHAPKSEDTPDLLLDLYLKRLKLAFGHVATPLLIRNTKNSPLYFIIWAGPHAAGLKGAEYILGGGEKLAAKRR